MQWPVAAVSPVKLSWYARRTLRCNLLIIEIQNLQEGIAGLGRIWGKRERRGALRNLPYRLKERATAGWFVGT